MQRAKFPVYKAIISRRTIRRFKQKSIPQAVLKQLINAARLAPSAANLQPLQFMIITDPDICAQIFTALSWAGYIAPRGDPPLGKRPIAYIVVLLDKIKAQVKYAAYDIGAAVENILLAAWEQGIGSCWMQAINRKRIRAILNISKYFKLDSLVSLGYPDESPIIEEFKGSIKYWKDKQGTLHVPKRNLYQIIHKSRL
ncbi:MAG: nitroreductase family protein [Candidatus Omnitrophota bacterium]|jgi:nitroreductase